MKQNETKYNKFALCREMLETIDLIEGFEQQISKKYVVSLLNNKSVLITGEGSSRIFPGKNFKDLILRKGNRFSVAVEGATEALDYFLHDHCVFGVSNSGKTKELIYLFTQLKKIGHPSIFALTATPESPITELVINSTVLKCGEEKAVAATKSVVEQALFFESLFYTIQGAVMPSLHQLARDLQLALEMQISKVIVELIAKAPVIYFAGRNNGVGEELALKTNEITRKKSIFLEGTYALHGIEEVMQKGEVLIVVDPFEQEEQKFYDVIQKGAEVQVIAISRRKTIFPTILLPENQEYHPYIELAGGWNLLVEVGLFLGIDLDKPVRARKIGNEV